jgi:type III pantothenate kinase
MLLAIDIGNSNIKFGIFDDDSLRSKFSIATKQDLTAGDIRSAVGKRLDNFSVNAVIVCSVVPDIERELRIFLKRAVKADAHFVTNWSDFGMVIKLAPLEAVGTDRLVNAFAAVEKYSVPCIVCSFGTATTIDLVNEKRELVGGLIAPGMTMMADALHAKTARLPGVQMGIVTGMLGSTTEDAIRSGILHSQVGLVEFVVGRIRSETAGNVKVVATGGSAAMIAGATDAIDLIDENLLLDGLRLINERT